jgi:hypothetical protein
MYWFHLSGQTREATETAEPATVSGGPAYNEESPK